MRMKYNSLFFSNLFLYNSVITLSKKIKKKERSEEGLQERKDENSSRYTFISFALNYIGGKERNSVANWLLSLPDARERRLWSKTIFKQFSCIFLH